ncbi:hypothetical protein B5F96_08460 [Parabacteroides johnsonii]|uniref:Uncharacterized protein n=1 Tax=Parabacteroides johnsonii TaxID=387661 RepID=A0A9Q5X865_9BACT|nr:hypothetical protein B5F96_08460 [Parabacteroides johnsonii]
MLELGISELLCFRQCREYIRRCRVYSRHCRIYTRQRRKQTTLASVLKYNVLPCGTCVIVLKNSCR